MKHYAVIIYPDNSYPSSPITVQGCRFPIAIKRAVEKYLKEYQKGRKIKTLKVVASVV